MKPDDPRHGTENGYSNLYCRCDECREAHRVYYVNRRQQKRLISTCPNCGGGGGMYDGDMCNACYEYKRKHGVHRPAEIYDPPAPGNCSNCGTEMERGRTVRGRCMTCADYLRRNGTERPERLYSPPTHCIICRRRLQRGRSSFGRCPACSTYLKRTGVERPEYLHNRTRISQPAVCTIGGCEKPTKAKAMCTMHLARFYRHGDPHTVKVMVFARYATKDVRYPDLEDDPTAWMPSVEVAS